MSNFIELKTKYINSFFDKSQLVAVFPFNMHYPEIYNLKLIFKNGESILEFETMEDLIESVNLIKKETKINKKYIDTLEKEIEDACEKAEQIIKETK